ncbi:heavy-metal-associated domain-containing protein [Tuanshanicoccus lijuaniae]|uniref:heavy-metal-associated domain-containing protein n=1 Tax=Aerococcaceae bacterium zg-1292 TaxID=2774330 RepID=UPI0019390576|nr:heavy-metal-associated domain-containing protein [Aerococcaceae bacterium zg-1292]MBF6625374.1 heavy-metal-associated domain-containing protein [Aerococcaceae bacterium zg-BR9]MBF6979034.1 heavy-metal-associated domain-containing protein [Aerococcaceae bacterium zg-BR22]MBS4456395.1 heavy-metal-associated domain-containing protein [Aerococcaceae bacterium zg-A91]MBS4458189.1 heavy-metal-associated domain-containing protein [Aerococcaceae bacterium zg-BR33]
MKKAILQLETLACPTCMQKIEGAIKNIAGVDKESVKVLFNASKAKTTFDDNVTTLDEIANAVRSIGYEVLKATEK